MRELPAEIRPLLRAYVAEVAKLFGSSLQAVILYGSLARGEYLHGRSNVNLMLVLEKYDLDLLRQYGKIHGKWKKEQVVVPLFVTEEDLRTSLDYFPLEYLEIKEQHQLLMGRDPFPELHPDLRHLEGQVQQEIRGNLLRVRQRFVEGGGTEDAVGILLPLSLTTLLPPLRGLFRLLNRPIPGSSEAMLADLDKAIQVDPKAFLEVLSVKRGLLTPGPFEVPRLFERYVQGLEALVSRLNQLKLQGNP